MSDDAPAFVHRLTVRFSDCDLLGHVNNAIYFTYFEEARLAWWRHLGGSLGFPGASTVIVHAECDYRAPAHMNDELNIRMTLGAVGRSSVVVAYEVLKVVTGQLIAEGKTINVTVDPETRRTVPVPAAARAMLERAQEGGRAPGH